MEKIHKNVNVFVLSCLIKCYMKAQERARFHVFSPFSTSFYPLLHHDGKGSIAHA